MPRKCCICQTSGKVKFNEVPSDPTLRAKWLKVIPNRDKLGENPIVCDRHFQDSDYDPNCKRRRLKRGVVPMVIPHSEMDFEPHIEEEDKERYLNFYNKEIKEKSVELIEVKSKLQQVESSIKDITKEDGNVDNQVRSVRQQIKQFKEENRKKTLKIDSIFLKVKRLRSQLTCQQQELKKKDKTILHLRKRLHVVEKIGIARSRGIKVNAITDQENYLKDRNIFNEQVDRLSFTESKLKTYIEKIEQMMSNVFRDRKASFLLDQIKLYRSKAPRYSDTSLQECIMWEDSDPAGYQFVRESDLLTLPSPLTMKKNLGLLPGEAVFEEDCSGVETTELQESGVANEVNLKCSDEVISEVSHLSNDNNFLVNASDERSLQVISEIIHMSDNNDVHSCDEQSRQVFSEIIYMPDDGSGFIQFGDQEIEVTFDS